MNKITQIVFYVILISSFCFGQDIPIDSTGQKSFPLEHSNKIQSMFYQFQLNHDIETRYLNSMLNNDANTIWLWTSYKLSADNFNGKFSDNTPKNILSPLYQQYLEESKFNPVRYILGMAQIGAAGYLAYRHIKKYGFAK